MNDTGSEEELEMALARLEPFLLGAGDDQGTVRLRSPAACAAPSRATLGIVLERRALALSGRVRLQPWLLYYLLGVPVLGRVFELLKPQPRSTR